MFVQDRKEAIDYLSHQPPFTDAKKYPCPDLMFLDLKMPRLNGFEVLEWIMENNYREKMPVVVLSGSDLPMDMLRAQSLCAIEYITKSGDKDLTADLLRSTCKRLLRHE